MQTLLGGHGVLEHVQADGAHELRVQGARRHGDLCVVCDGFLRHAVELIQRQLPCLVNGILFRGRHGGGGGGCGCKGVWRLAGREAEGVPGSQEGKGQVRSHLSGGKRQVQQGEGAFLYDF